MMTRNGLSVSAAKILLGASLLVCFRSLWLCLIFWDAHIFHFFLLSQSGTKRTGTGAAAPHAAAVERGRGGAEREEAGNAAATARTAAIDAGARGNVVTLLSSLFKAQQ